MTWWHSADTLQRQFPLLPTIASTDGLQRHIDIGSIDAMLEQQAQHHCVPPHIWTGFSELTPYGFARLAGWNRADTEQIVRLGHAPFLARAASVFDTFAIYVQLEVDSLSDSDSSVFAITRRPIDDGFLFSLDASRAFASPLDAMLSVFSANNSVLYGILELYVWFRLRSQIAAVCIALQPLELPALITLTIVDELFARSSLFTMALKWRVITTIKHFHSRH